MSNFLATTLRFTEKFDYPISCVSNKFSDKFPESHGFVAVKVTIKLQ